MSLRSLSLGLGFLLGFISNAHAAAGFGSPGTAGADFLKIPSDTRAAGMAGAVVAISEGLEALEYNPARLSSVLGWELGGQHLGYAEGIALEQVAFGWGREKLGLGLSVLSLSTPSIPTTDITGQVTGSFKQQDLAYSGGMGWGQGRWSVGLLGRGIQRSLAGLSYAGAEADLGLSIDLWHGWRVATALQHLGTLGALADTADPAPMTLRGGLGWTTYNAAGLQFQTELDAVQSRDSGLQARYGFEAGWSYFFGRAGVQWSQAYEGRQPFTVGAGIRYSSWQLDYAFADLQGIGSAQRVGLSWRLDGAIRGRRGLQAPKGLMVLRQGKLLNLNWDPVQAASGYAIYVRKGPQASLVRVARASASQTKTRLKLAGDEEVGMAVASLTEDGQESPLSEELRVNAQETQAATVPAPKNLRIEMEEGRAMLRWDPSAESGDFTYQVLVSRRNGVAYAPWGKPIFQTQKALPKDEEAWKETRYVVLQAFRRGVKGQEASGFSEELSIGTK